MRSHSAVDDLKSGRIPVLDGIRGLAILMILLLHAFSQPGRSLAGALAVQLTRSMWLGVDLFFVLSGYLITGILLRAKQQPQHFFRDFYIRRTLRIFPAYYFVLALVFFVFPLLSPPLAESALPSYAPSLLLYLQNWVMALSGQGLPWLGVDHLWSLAIEEQFYLLWPLVVYLTPRARLPQICTLLFAVALVAKLLLAQRGAGWLPPYMSTIARLDPLVAGALVAATAGAPVDALRRWMPLLIGGALTVLLLAAWRAHGLELTVFNVVVVTPAAAIVFAALLYRVDRRMLSLPALQLLSMRWLTWLGRYSYGIYLLHFPIYVMLMEWAERNVTRHGADNYARVAATLGALAIGLTLAAAWLMFRYLEAPALRLAHRFRSTPLAPIAAPP